jgi:hypothetical protein
MKPRGKFTTPAACQHAREYLGASKAELARVMRLGATGRDTVRRYETEPGAVTGPYQLALEALVSGWRPWGVRFKIDKEADQ